MRNLDDLGSNIERSAFRGRITRQRAAIAQAANAMPGTFSAEDLIRAVQQAASHIGQATVYRALGAMVESGFIERIGESDGAAVYARCHSGAHHHHIVCTGCGRVEDMECSLDDVLTQVAGASGFRVTRHEFNLFGICRTCAASNGGGADANCTAR